MMRRPNVVDTQLPTVALVGRVNVGKSSLFNKITETRRAIVNATPGTTRTRNSAPFTWRGKQACIIDAGGLTFHKEQPFETDILKQTERAVADADVVLLIMDAHDGVLPQEREIAKFLHKKKIQAIPVMNKADAPRDRDLAHDAHWLKLGFGTPRAVSAVNGTGVGDLLDELFTRLQRAPRRPKQLKAYAPIRVAIVGKPNVGKSTLLNQIAGEQHVITSPIPHTTRESFSLLVHWDKHYLEFLDTAGMRRKSNVDNDIERAGVSQSVMAIEDSDVVLLMVDATEPMSVQEKTLARLIESKRRSVILVVNKCDLLEETGDAMRASFTDFLRHAYPHISFAPIIFISAHTGYRVHQLYDAIVASYDARHKEIDDHALDAFLRNLIAHHRPTRGIGNVPPKLYAIKQMATDPPQFQVSVKARTSLNSSYIRFMERALRETFGFIGTPIAMYTKKTKQ